MATWLAPAASHAADPCGAIVDVTGRLRDGAGLAGAQIHEGKFEGALAIPGLDRCTLTNVGRTIYECWKVHPTPAAALAGARALTGALKGCPGLQVGLDNSRESLPAGRDLLHTVLMGGLGPALVLVNVDTDVEGSATGARMVLLLSSRNAPGLPR